MAAWWLWVALGIVLAILEVLVPAWVFLGFAIGAVAVGLMLAFHAPLLAYAAGAPAALLVLYALLSLAAWAGLRAALGVRKRQVRLWDEDINEVPRPPRPREPDPDA